MKPKLQDEEENPPTYRTCRRPEDMDGGGEW